MIEKTHLTPSSVGIQSARLAKLTYFLDHLGGRDSATARIVRVGREEVEKIMSSVPPKKRSRLVRLAWDQRGRMGALDEDPYTSEAAALFPKILADRRGIISG